MDDRERKSPEWDKCIHVARWIPRAFDMYCNLEEVIRVCMVVEQYENTMDEDDDSLVNLKKAYEKITATL